VRVLGVFLLSLSAFAESSAKQPRILVAASSGEIIPQAKGGGGFQRSFRFRVAPLLDGRWVRQRLAVRGTVFDDDGKRRAVHLDVVEYYRVDRKGRARQIDSHYSQFRKARGGDLKISSTLAYGTLESKKRGDPIMAKTFILRGATNAEGEHVTMRKRTTGEVIPAEKGEKVEFEEEDGALSTRYRYAVSWDTRPGKGSRAEPSGKIGRGTWNVVLPKTKDRTKETAKVAPIPELKKRP
jgi:hypothetical protein